MLQWHFKYIVFRSIALKLIKFSFYGLHGFLKQEIFPKWLIVYTSTNILDKYYAESYDIIPESGVVQPG